MNGRIHGLIGGVINGKVDTLGSLLNYPWMKSPYWCLPESGLSLVVGTEVTIYGDTLINTPISNNLQVTYTCDIGTQSGKNFVINPVSGDIGVHQLTFRVRNSGVLIIEETINLNIYALSTATKKVLFIGDSVTSQGITYYASKINEVLAGSAITFVGTQGTTVKHEGRSGWTFAQFITNGSPFYKSGAINIAAYFADNSIDVPDIIKIDLGINDIFPSCEIAGDGLTDAEIVTIIGRAKTLIDAFIAYNPAIRIILGVPTTTSNTVAGWNANYDESVYSQDLFINNLCKYRDAFVSEFENGKYSAVVDCSYEFMLIDRNDGYPKTDGVHTNGVHPDQSGYEQLGVGKAIYFNRDFQNRLMPSGLTLSLISGGVKIDWTDNSGGLFETEIWGKNDSDSYALLYTIAAGTVTKSETINPVDLRYYKIRGKKGGSYTDFTAEQSIAMLGSELLLNPNFANWSGDNPVSWSISESSPNLVTGSSGAARFVTTGAYIGAMQQKLTNGKKYRLRVVCTARVSGSLTCFAHLTSAGVVNAVGTFTFYQTANGTDFALNRTGGATDITLSSASAKEILMP